jgi:multidrug efflux pump subunit AcrB
VKLKKIAEDLQDEIEGLEEITRADIVGALDREIQINVDLYKMQAADLSFYTIQNAIASENLTISGGQVDTDGIRRNLRVVGEFRNIDQIKNIQLRQGIYLREIAEVVDGYADRGSYSRLDRQDVVTINVIKKSGKNLIYAVDKIKVIVDEHRKAAPENLIITMTGDTSTQTKNTNPWIYRCRLCPYVFHGGDKRPVCGDSHPDVHYHRFHSHSHRRFHHEHGCSDVLHPCSRNCGG